MSLSNLLRRLLPGPDCRQVAAVMQAYLDGELGAGQADFVASHLEACERCGIDYEIYSEVKRSLEQLRAEPSEAAMSRLRSFAAGLKGPEA